MLSIKRIVRDVKFFDTFSPLFPAFVSFVQPTKILRPNKSIDCVNFLNLCLVNFFDTEKIPDMPRNAYN